MLLGSVPAAVLAAQEVTEIDITIKPPAIGEYLDFEPTVGDESLYEVTYVDWYISWDGGESHYRNGTKATGGIPYELELYVEAVGDNYIPEDTDKLKVTVNGSSEGITLTRDDERSPLYCHLEFKSLGYTVSFDANGGSGTMEDVSKVWKEFTLPECAFTAPEGMIFIGWTVGGTEGKWYFPESTASIDSDVTFYAKWVDTDPSRTYTLTFIDYAYLVPGTTDYPMKEVTVGAGKYTLPENFFYLDDASLFDYWGIDTDGDGRDEKFYPGDVIDVYGDLEISVWRTYKPGVKKCDFNASLGGVYHHGMLAGLVSVSVLDSPHISLANGGYGHGYWITEGDKILEGTDTVSSSFSHYLYVRYAVEDGYYYGLTGDYVRLFGVFGELTSYSNPVLQPDGSYIHSFRLPPVPGSDITDEKVLFTLEGYERDKRVTSITADVATDDLSIVGSGYGSLIDGNSYMIWKDYYSYGCGVYDGPSLFEPATDYYVQIAFRLDDGYSFPADFYDGNKLKKDKFALSGFENAEVHQINNRTVGYEIIFKLPQIEATPIESLEIVMNGYEPGESSMDITFTYPECIMIPEPDIGYYSHYWFYDISYEYGFGGDFLSIPYGSFFEKGSEYYFTMRLYVEDGYSAFDLKKENVTLKTSYGTCTATRLQRDADYDYYWLTFDMPSMAPKVTFEAGGGSGSMADVSVYGVYTLPKCEFISPFDRIFGGWSIDGVIYRPGDTLLILEDTVITATWKRAPLISYTASFLPGEGSGSLVRQNGVTGEITLPRCTFSPPIGPIGKGGFVFAGWCLNDTDIVLLPGTTVRITADTVFTALWTLDSFSTYTVFFDANGGSGYYGPANGMKGSYTLPSCPFTPPAGTQFKAWSVDGEEYAVGSKITLTKDITVTAVWENIYVITFDGHGGHGTIDPITMTEGTYTLPECDFTAPDGMVFSFWEIGGKKHYPGEIMTVSAHLTLRAFWEKAPEFIRGDADGDGKINTKDVLMLRKYLGGAISKDRLNLSAADADLDGKITMKDVLMLRKYLGGVITEFPQK